MFPPMLRTACQRLLIPVGFAERQFRAKRPEGPRPPAEESPGSRGGKMPRGLYIALVAVLVIAVVVLTSAVVRLENYRYANFTGICETPTALTESDITAKPRQRIEREKCLETTQTRTHWFWHVLYGVGLL
jgi:hypothetical protein